MTLAEPITRPFDFDPEPDLTLARINVEQFGAMIDAGIFYEDATLELIDGLIVRNESNRGEGVIKQRHFFSTAKLARWARSFDETTVMLNVQLPVALTEFDQPIPDGTVVRGPLQRYQDRMPGPADIAVVIEIASATLRSDRKRKLKMYARAGIPQYVIVNLIDDVVEVHVMPDAAAGTYAAPTIVSRDGTVTFRLFDGQALAVSAADLLP